MRPIKAESGFYFVNRIDSELFGTAIYTNTDLDTNLGHKKWAPDQYSSGLEIGVRVGSELVEVQVNSELVQKFLAS